MKVVCQACGTVCRKQADVVMNGLDNLWICPNCTGDEWQEVDENSLPCQIENE